MKFKWFLPELDSVINILVRILVILSVLSAVGTYVAIYQSADSNPVVVRAFVLLVTILILILTALVIGSLIRVYRGLRLGQVGAKLQTRVLTMFSIVTIVPVIIVAVFAAAFFTVGIEGWFSKRVSVALDKSVAVAEAYSAEHKKRIEGDALWIASKLNKIIDINSLDNKSLSNILDRFSIERGINEAALITADGSIKAQSRYSFILSFDFPLAEIFKEPRQTDPLFLLPEKDNRVYVITPVSGHLGLYLYVGRIINPKVTDDIILVKSAANEYLKAQQQSEGSQITFTMVFISVAFLLLLAAVWLGITFSNALTRPISELVNAAEEVRKGNLDINLSESGNDEITTLIKSFNRMTGQLKDQRRELIDANEQLDNRRRFTESVLAGVTSGVIGLKPNGEIFLPNPAAMLLLNSNAGSLIGSKLDRVIPEMTELLQEAKRDQTSMAQDQVVVTRGNKSYTLMVRIAGELDKGRITGYVVTFENITNLLSAQKIAAWTDIAKRIAHEIKNPLTPIKLAAERLKRKFTSEINSDPAIFTNCIDTIVRQVEGIRSMVDEFSVFARMPQPDPQEVILGKIVTGAQSMIDLAHKNISCTANVEEFINHKVEIDSNQINQAINNLLQNSIDSINTRTQKTNKRSYKGKIDITLSIDNDLCFIEVLDNGCGLPNEKRDTLVEPYVTSREGGTGLGLAIVKRVMDDHNGQLKLEDADIQGTKATLVFPRYYNKSLSKKSKKVLI